MEEERRGFASILLGTDNERLVSPVVQTLRELGYDVSVVSGYTQMEELSHKQTFDAVLIEISTEDSVEQAVLAAITIKQRNPQQYIGYLADPIHYPQGLAGDAILPRDSKRLAVELPAALPRHRHP